MNWFKKLFSGRVGNQSWPDFKCGVPMPKVKPCKEEKNVSEPVVSMVKAWEKDKKRFTFDIKETNGQDSEYRLASSSGYCKTYKIEIEDLKTDEVFEVYGYDTPINSCSIMYIPMRFYSSDQGIPKRHNFSHKAYLSSHLTFTSYPSWITRDEVEYIYDYIKDYYEERTNKYKELINYRIDRKLNDAIKLSERAKAEERQRLVEIYK